VIKRLAKMVCRMPGAVTLARTISRRRPIILMYHGVTANPDIVDWTQVAVDDFEDQMDHLRRNYQPVSLTDLVGMLQSGRIEPHAVAVTFDDGYKSNHDLAYPILKEMGIPATIFVTSGFVTGAGLTNSLLWPDFVTAVVLSLPGQSLDWHRLDLGQWDLSSLRTIYAARTGICEQLKSMPDKERKRLIGELDQEYGGYIDLERFPDYRPMSPAEVRNLAANDLITIGAHTRTHPILSRLDGSELAGEIVGGKEDLETMTGKTVNHFAYPNGRRQDISRETLDLVAANFACAVTTETGVNLQGHNKYLLRRVGIGRNLSPTQFAILLSGAYFVFQKAVHEL